MSDIKKLSVKIHKQGIVNETLVANGANLLQHLQAHNINVIAPCGGNGTCGKCKVFVVGLGEVVACKTTIQSDIELILPDDKTMNVLSAQHRYEYPAVLTPFKNAEITDKPLGIAIDIGTTTLVLYLIDLVNGETLSLSSCINPQVQFGADVITRIQFCMQNLNGLETLQKLLIDELNKEIEVLCRKANKDSNDIAKIVITGNTTMLHIIAGVNPESIGKAPYKAEFVEAMQYKSHELNLLSNKSAEVNLMPSLSAFVGADIIAGVASLKMPDQFKNYLFVDIGTNGEMALVTPNEIFCCATAAGPAFEGANISCGMPAKEGAIDSFKNGNYSVIGEIEPMGICGSGLLDAISYMLETNCLSTEGVLNEEFVLYENKGVKISINQEDIREFQLAKSAIVAGMISLIKKANLNLEDIDALLVAGGFGNYLNQESAFRVGLYPNEIQNVITVGNTAISGALLYLKSNEFVERTEYIKRRSENYELFDDDNFVMEYAAQMSFPTF